MSVNTKVRGLSTGELVGRSISKTLARSLAGLDTLEQDNVSLDKFNAETKRMDNSMRILARAQAHLTGGGQIAPELRSYLES